jgi:hypothetical protein
MYSVKLLLVEASETCTKRQDFTSTIVRNSGLSKATDYQAKNADVKPKND